jgi:plasmid stability protein
MATLYVRDVPEDVVEKLKGLAARERRSVSAQVLAMVESVLGDDEWRQKNQALLLDIRERRKRMSPARPGEDAVSLLREDRSR